MNFYQINLLVDGFPKISKTSFLFDFDIIILSDFKSNEKYHDFLQLYCLNNLL